MGRGISGLQKTILSLAYKNRQAEGRTANTDTGADAYYWELLIEYWGWQPSGTCRCGMRFDGTPIHPLNVGAEGYGRRIPSSKKFNRSSIGSDKYNAAMAALSRAAGRLEQRGLITIRVGKYGGWRGIALTDSGALMAASVQATEATA